MAAAPAVVLVLLFALALPAARSETYIVGGSSQWNTGVNYNSWLQGKTFRVGDVLLFQYPAGTHDVLKVSQTDYTNCNGNNPSSTYTSGNDSVALSSAGTHYYICGFANHCNPGGMKVAVPVIAASGNPSSPPPPRGTPSRPPPPRGSAPPTPSPSGGPTSQPQSPPSPPGNASPRGIGYNTGALLGSVAVLLLSLVS